MVEFLFTFALREWFMMLIIVFLALLQIKSFVKYRSPWDPSAEKRETLKRLIVNAIKGNGEREKAQRLLAIQLVNEI